MNQKTNSLLNDNDVFADKFGEITVEEKIVSKIPKLSKLCEEKLMKGTLNDLMTAFSALKYTDMDDIKSRILDHLKSRFALLIERYEKDALIDLFTEEEYMKMEKKLNDRLQAEKLMKVRSNGNVLEPLKPSSTSTSSLTSSSKSGDGSNGFYPYEMLIQGVVWPTDVDPTKREQYLSNEDFHQIFDISKTDFKALRHHVQIRLKKEKSLF